MNSRPIAISYKTRRMLAEGRDNLPPGAAHYSYKNVRDKFVECFTEFGVPHFELDRPELYPHWRRNPRPVLHMQIKPFEEIRRLRGVPNVAHVAWEFEKLPSFGNLPADDERRMSPLNDCRHMLGLADEVWVGSNYAKKVVSDAGVRDVHFVPAPIRTRREATTRNIREATFSGSDSVVIATASKLSKVRAWLLSRYNVRALDDPNVVSQDLSLTEALLSHRNALLLIANAGDMRKNLPAALLAMRRMPRDAQCCLILKLVSDGSHKALSHAILHDLARRFRELGLERDDFAFPKVYIVNAHLGEAELGALYSSVHFYLCTAFAEGQNLPLQEAMSHGVIPISVANTAMLDYLDPSNSVEIATREVAASKAFENAYALPGIRLSSCSDSDVADAVERAIGADGPRRLQLARAARAAIERQYAFEKIAGVVEGRLAATAGRV